jgi:hypothetical protein
MISLGLVRLIEVHSDELAAELVAKLESSSCTSDLHKVPVEELRRRIHEILQHLSEWLLTNGLELARADLDEFLGIDGPRATLSGLR